VIYVLLFDDAQPDEEARSEVLASQPGMKKGHFIETTKGRRDCTLFSAEKRPVEDLFLADLFSDSI
jgi:hypothetical protein